MHQRAQVHSAWNIIHLKLGLSERSRHLTQILAQIQLAHLLAQRLLLALGQRLQSLDERRHFLDTRVEFRQLTVVHVVATGLG